MRLKKPLVAIAYAAIAMAAASTAFSQEPSRPIEPGLARLA